ncbi:stage III sporulation protein AF [Alicyclobacillus tolerans]|uniref:stage III sporulation protein AF n=1 Tax=Alicyclobacillus tolerans TaxID=90970 RepID=UPI001F02D0EC|nr:stage III sporulation protein AF [Alicyclobacillus tolerans]MCF8563588.1 stage III sporulation protein AF [Alicyclobacillus tolerans]
MTALGVWLKQIIMIVLLAVFSDLLLPTKTMQKYVRSVMGLAIIAAMLQPILPFFKRDWADQLAQTASQELTRSQNVQANQGAQSQTPSSSQTQLRYQQDLAQQQAQEANALTAQEIQQLIPQHFGFSAKSVSVTGATQATGALVVQIALFPADSSHANDVKSFVANDLGVAPSQVVVQTG